MTPHEPSFTCRFFLQNASKRSKNSFNCHKEFTRFFWVSSCFRKAAFIELWTSPSTDAYSGADCSIKLNVLFWIKDPLKQLIETRQTYLTFLFTTADHEKRVNNNDQSVENCCLHVHQAVRNQAEFSGKRFDSLRVSKLDVSSRVNKSDICFVSRAENGTWHFVMIPCSKSGVDVIGTFKNNKLKNVVH